MDLTLRIQRYNPDIDEAPYVVEYAVTAEPINAATRHMAAIRIV